MATSSLEHISSPAGEWLNSLNMEQCHLIRNWLNARIKFLKSIPLIKKKVEDLQLSTRAYNALKANELNTVEDILQFGTENIWRLANVGPKTVREIMAAITEK